MFDTNYYCLVAGLREYSLDGGAKGFDPHAILDEILRELTPRDLRAVRLLYGYYDCKNLIALRAGSPAHDPLGNFARERLKEETEHPRLLPHAIGLVLAAYARPDGEEAEEVDTSRPFEQALFEAYYGLCAASPSRFLREWSDFDRTLRNVAAVPRGFPSTGTSWVTTTWPSSCAVRRPPTSACGANCPTSMR